MSKSGVRFRGVGKIDIKNSHNFKGTDIISSTINAHYIKKKKQFVHAGMIHSWWYGGDFINGNRCQSTWKCKFLAILLTEGFTSSDPAINTFTFVTTGQF